MHAPRLSKLHRPFPTQARITQGGLLKKIVEGIGDLVTQANFDCCAGGITLQAMDASHVSLVALCLEKDTFDCFRCDKNISLGINMSSMGKVRPRRPLRVSLPSNVSSPHIANRYSGAATMRTR